MNACFELCIDINYVISNSVRESYSVKQQFISMLLISILSDPFLAIAANNESKTQRHLSELLPPASIIAHPIVGLKERKVIPKFEDRKFYYYDPVTRKYEETLRPVQNEFKNDPALFGKNDEKKLIVPLGPFQDLF